MIEMNKYSPPDWSKRRTLKILSLAGSTLLSGFNASADSSSLKVGFLNNYLPFSYVDAQGQLKGFDVEVVSRLVEVLNLKIEIVTAGMAELNHRLKDKKN